MLIQDRPFKLHIFQAIELKGRLSPSEALFLHLTLYFSNFSIHQRELSRSSNTKWHTFTFKFSQKVHICVNRGVRNLYLFLLKASTKSLKLQFS